jgi:hypothetical protein
MSEVKANKDTIDDLNDIHQGLHVAMDAVFNENDLTKLKLTLRQIDERMTSLINALNGAQTGRW